MHDHAILQGKQAAEIYDEVGESSLERLFPGFTEDRSEQATHSAGQSGIGYKSAGDTAGPSQPGFLAETTSGDQPCSYQTKLLPSFTFKKASQAADDTWQQTVEEHNGLAVTTPTVSEIEHCRSASPDDDEVIWISLRLLGRAHTAHRSSKRGFHGFLTGLD